VAVDGDDHDQVAAIVGSESEADAEQATDRDEPVRDRVPRDRRCNDRDGQKLLSQTPLVVRDQSSFSPRLDVDRTKAMT
jgi:hypothetical protein